MKTIKRKGFTLVELLVVIAILAILATVSVVGYTSFIERTNVSVDNNTVSQLNHFLAAYKVDNYGLVIDEHNVREVTRDILEESGLEALVPKSKNHHFYFDFAEGEYALVEDDVATGEDSGVLFSLMTRANGSLYDVVPGNCFTIDNQYYFVDTEGSNIANIINSFYTHTGENEFDEATFAAFVESASAAKVGTSAFANLLADSLFVTNGGVYFVEGSTRGSIYFHDNENLVIDKPLNIELEVNNGVVTPFEIPSNVGQIDTGSLTFTNMPENYTGVVFTVDMDAEAFADVVLYDPALETVNFEMSGNVIGTLGTSDDGMYVIKTECNEYDLDIIKNKVVQITSDRLTHVGNANALKLSDLFYLRNGLKSLPTGDWKLVIKNANGNLIPSTSEVSGELLVDNAEHVLSVTNGALTDIEIKFTNTEINNKITIAVLQPDGTEYAAVNVHVVAAKNVRSWAELAGSDSTAVASTSTSIVMLDNITMPEILADVKYYNTSDSLLFSEKTGSLPTAEFTISGGATLYGNHFTFDVTNGLVTGKEGIITVTGHLKDVRIIGRIFSEYGPRVNQIWGSNVVKANGGSTITNCYIANGRAPIRVSGNVTIEDTVLFGGRYANICATGTGTLTLKGTVVTVNQPHNNPNDDVDDSVVGVGIAVWYDSKMQGSHDPTITVTEGAKLMQYNFVHKSQATNLPTVSIGVTSVNVGKVFESLFEGSQYSDYIFGNGNDEYISAANINLNDSKLNISEMAGYSATTGEYMNIYTTHVYLPENDGTAANDKLFADSLVATDKYSHWNTNDYPAYDFELVDGEYTIIH